MRISASPIQTLSPDSFVLLLAENGATRRRCRVIWRKPRAIGIKFESWLDDRIRAGVKPNTDKVPKKIRQRSVDALRLLNG